MPKTPGFLEPPPLLLPAGYVDMDRAVEIARRPEDDPRARIQGCSPAEHRLRAILASGRASCVLQFYKDGTTFPMLAAEWMGPRAPMFFEDNGSSFLPGCSDPDDPAWGLDGAEVLIRVHEAQLLIAIDVDQAAPPTAAEPKRGSEPRAAAIDEAPEQFAALVGAVDPYRTGAAGRPTAKHLAIAELERRLDAGEGVTSNQDAFALEISGWLEERHPSAPLMKPKTLQNSAKFRSLFRRLKALGTGRLPTGA